MAEERCPKCGSRLIVEIGSQKHCNSCSLDYDAKRVVTPTVERSAKSGWR